MYKPILVCVIHISLEGKEEGRMYKPILVCVIHIPLEGIRPVLYAVRCVCCVLCTLYAVCVCAVCERERDRVFVCLCVW